jgi:hypothetical membrane protein
VTGVVAPAWCAAATTAAALLHPGYSFRSDNISGLGLGRDGWLLDGALVVCGCLLTGFSTGLHGEIGDRALGALGAALLAVSGCAAMLAGIFPTDPPSVRPQTLHSTVHDIAFVVVVLGLLLASLDLGIHFRRTPAWEDLATFSLACCGSVAALFAVFLAVGDGSTWKGLIQRTFLMIAAIWLERLALRMWRLSRFDAAKSTSRSTGWRQVQRA